MTEAHHLPPGVTVLERGWLSSNCTLLIGPHSAMLVDSGYGTHAAQTLALVQSALPGRVLDGLMNTHLHSDHCGGNAALQEAYPALQTLIPPGQAEHVRVWDAQALTYEPTGQMCPRFRMDGVLQPGTTLCLGDVDWQVHAAPGHDPHSVILFEPASRVLISADALWERGFGVVFPELEGDDAFAAVGDTLDLIESLAPRLVIPGHGRVFSAVAPALANARQRLATFAADPHKHRRYAAKVLLKFKLLELQQLPESALLAWAQRTPYFALVHAALCPEQPLRDWLTQVIDELVRSGAAERQSSLLLNRD